MLVSAVTWYYVRVMRTRTKTQQKAGTGRAQASRIKKPPQFLGSVIDLVRLIPSDYKPHRWGKRATAETREAFDKEDNERAFQLIRDELQKCLSGLPERLVDYVNEGSLIGINSARERYKALMWWREVLLLIIDITRAAEGFTSQAAAVDKYENELDLTEAFRRGNGMSIPVDKGANITLYPDFTLKVRVDPLLDDLQEVDLRRIRLCDVCNSLFWAGRSNQTCCTRKCAHVLRNRRYRARYQEGFYKTNLTSKEKAQLQVKRNSTKKGK